MGGKVVSGFGRGSKEVCLMSLFLKECNMEEARWEMVR